MLVMLKGLSETLVPTLLPVISNSDIVLFLCFISFIPVGGSDSGIVEVRNKVAKLGLSATNSVQRQASAPVRPESLMLNSMLDDLDQLSKDLDSCLESGDSSRGESCLNCYHIVCVFFDVY